MINYGDDLDIGWCYAKVRKIAARVLITLLVLVLFEGNFNHVSADNGKTTLVIWSFTNELQDMLEQYYLPDHPELEIEFQIYPTDENIYTDRLDRMLNNENALSDNAPDVFTLEAAFVKKYVNSNATGDLRDIGLEDDDYGSVYAPVLETGKNQTTNQQKALSWQASPTVLMYRASLAYQYLGVTSPEEFAERVSDYNSFLKTARELESASGGVCKMITGTGDLDTINYSDSTVWIEDGQLNITDDLYTITELSRNLEEEDLTQKAGQWSEV